MIVRPIYAPALVAWVGGENCVERFNRAGCLERTLAAEHLVHGRTQGEKVRPGIDLFTLHLLGRHVPGCADNPASQRLRCFGPHVIRCRLQLRDAKVEDLHATVGAEKHVVGFEIPMDNSPSVGGAEAVCNFQGDCDGIVQRERSPFEAFAQALSFETFGHDERGAVMLADVVDGKDIRVVECPGRSRFVCKTTHAFGIGREVRQHDLDRHMASETLVPSAPHFASAACPKQAFDRV